jgi:ribonuclease HI
MSQDPHALKIYIDGCAYDNPGGAGGLAGLQEHPDDWDRPAEFIFQEGYRSTTNNRMELMACIRAHEYVRERGSALGVQRVQIITDSLYVYNGLKSAVGWKRNHWRTREGRPVENDDLWQQLLTLRTKVKIRTDILWEKGKRAELPKAIDKAAKAAGKEPWRHDWGFREGKVGRSKVMNKSASQPFPAAGQEATIRIYRHGIIGRAKEPKFLFDFLSESEQQFISKYHAYTTPELAFHLHRGHTYRVRFSADPKYPQIVEIMREI